MRTCPQCNAEVPSDDAFCGKCGYAMRDQGPHHLDRSRIRVHEGPSSDPPAPPSGRPRQKTVLGIPSVPPKASASTESSDEKPAAPAKRVRAPQKTMLGLPHLETPNQGSPEEVQKTQELSLTDLTFHQKTQELSLTDLTVQKTQELSLTDLIQPPPTKEGSEAGVLPDAEAGSEVDDVEAGEPDPGSEAAGTPQAVEPDQSQESLPMLPTITDRRKTAFVACAFLVALSAGWLIYRFLAGPAA